MGAMYYTKDKLSEMKDICSKITELEKANYKALIDAMEDHTYTIETNLDEMEANINMLTSSSGMSYVDDDQDLDSAFSNNTEQPVQETAADESSDDDDDDGFDDDDDLLDDDDDDFLEE
jgi:hypothetical protein